MRKVAIATPALDGRVDASYAHALAETVVLGLSYGIQFVPLFVVRDALIQRARNDLFAMAHNSDCTDMIWVDSDTVWRPQWAIDILRHPVDVVGYTSRYKRDDGEAYVVNASPDALVPNAQGLMEVTALGTGFLRLSRRAINHLWDSSEPYQAAHGNTAERRWVFDVRPVDGVLISEDVMICRKLREGGFQIWLDPSKTCDHIGTKVYAGDFAAWVMRLHAERRNVNGHDAEARPN